MKDTIIKLGYLSRIDQIKALLKDQPAPCEKEPEKRMLKNLLADENREYNEVSRICIENWQKMLASLFSDLSIESNTADSVLRKLTYMWNESPYKENPEYAYGIFSGVLRYLSKKPYESAEEAQTLIDLYYQAYRKIFGRYNPNPEDAYSDDIEKRHCYARFFAGNRRAPVFIRRNFGEMHHMNTYDLAADDYWVDTVDLEYMEYRNSENPAGENLKISAEYKFDPPEGDSRWKDLRIRRFPCEKPIQFPFFGLAAAVTQCLAGRKPSTSDCVFATAHERDLNAVEKLGKDVYTFYLKEEDLCRKHLEEQNMSGFISQFRRKFSTELSNHISVMFYEDWEDSEFPLCVPHSSSMTMVYDALDTCHTSWKGNPFRTWILGTEESSPFYDEEIVMQAAKETADKVYEYLLDQANIRHGKKDRDE